MPVSTSVINLAEESLPVNKSPIPSRLRTKVPPAFTMFLEQRLFWELFGLGLCCLGLFVLDVRTVRVRSVYLAFLGPFLVPAMVVARYIFYPLNPYKTVAGKIAPARKALQDDDPDRRRLIEILQSPAAWKFAARRSAQLSGVLILASFLFVLIMPAPIVWMVNPPHLLVVGTIVALIGGMGIVNTELVCWALMRWVEEA